MACPLPGRGRQGARKALRPQGRRSAVAGRGHARARSPGPTSTRGPRGPRSASGARRGSPGTRPGGRRRSGRRACTSRRSRPSSAPMPLARCGPSHVRSWTSRLRAEDLAASPTSTRCTRGWRRSSPTRCTTASCRGRRARGGRRPGRAAARLRGHHGAGVGAARRDAGAAARRPSCSARSPGCGSPRRAGCGSADVDFMRGVIHPRVQYPAQELKTEISRTPVPIPRSLALELAAHVKRLAGGDAARPAPRWWPAATVGAGARRPHGQGQGATACRMVSGTTTCGTTSRRS